MCEVERGRARGGGGEAFLGFFVSIEFFFFSSFSFFFSSFFSIFINSFFFFSFFFIFTFLSLVTQVSSLLQNLRSEEEREGGEVRMNFFYFYF